MNQGYIHRRGSSECKFKQRLLTFLKRFQTHATEHDSLQAALHDMFEIKTIMRKTAAQKKKIQYLLAVQYLLAAELSVQQ